MINSKGCLRRVWGRRRPKPPRDGQAAGGPGCRGGRERSGVRSTSGWVNRTNGASSMPLVSVESINETFKGQLDLGRHRGHTPGGVLAHVMQRILALTAAIWHDDATGQTVLRSLIAYHH